ncbi:PspC domain-containing protein [Microbacteriaceae bacterium VKM Ac-2854]|nr:PspC domain-containing protein [Microbacteriaceae bacterium VKM Ac-2854]
MNETTTPPPAAPTNSGRRQNSFFDWLRGLGIVRGPDSWIGGVCSALAVRTNLDPLVIRGIFVVVGLLSGGVAVLAYAVAWALLPDGGGTIHAEEVSRGRWEAPSIAILVIAVIGLFNRGLWWSGSDGFWGMPDWLAATFGTGWTLVWVGAIVWFTIWLIRGARSAKQERQAARAADPSTPAAQTPVYGAPSVTDYDPASAAERARADAARLRAEAEQVRRQAREQATTQQTTTQSAHLSAHQGYARQQAAQAKAEARRVRREIEAKVAAEHAVQWRRRRPGGGFVVIVLGLAAVVGGLTSASATALNDATGALLLGGIAALAVLALGMIVSGIRGKVGGAMSGFAFLLVVLIALGSLVPRDSSLNVFGPSPTWRPSSLSASTDERHTVLAGAPTLDLSNVSPLGASTGAEYEIWLGAGRMLVEVPDDLTVRIESESVIGGVNFDGFTSAQDTVDRANFFFGDSQTVGPAGSPDVTVVIHSLIGSVDVQEVSR